MIPSGRRRNIKTCAGGLLCVNADWNTGPRGAARANRAGVESRAQPGWRSEGFTERRAGRMPEQASREMARACPELGWVLGGLCKPSGMFWLPEQGALGSCGSCSGFRRRLSPNGPQSPRLAPEGFYGRGASEGRRARATSPKPMIVATAATATSQPGRRLVSPRAGRWLQGRSRSAREHQRHAVVGQMGHHRRQQAAGCERHPANAIPRTKVCGIRSGSR